MGTLISLLKQLLSATIYLATLFAQEVLHSANCTNTRWEWIFLSLQHYFVTLDREVCDEAYGALNGFENKIRVQAVPNVDRHATVEASIKSSSPRRVFSILNLTLYIRLTGLRANSAYMTVAEIEYIRFQDYFASRMTTSETAHFYLLLMRVTKSALKIYHCIFWNAYTPNKMH